MKINYFIISFITIIGLLSSCSNSNKKVEGNAKQTDVVQESVTYLLGEGETVLTNVDEISEDKVVGLAKNSASVNWVAFKTTEKKPVGGTFNEVVVTGIKKSRKIIEAFKGAAISIPIIGINSKNEGRDEKLARAFFGTMTNTNMISGTILEFVQNDEVIIEIVLNDIKQKVTCKYSLNKEIFTMDGTINLLDFGAEKAINNLNTECNDLHKGKDGISKLWSDVAVSFSAVLTEKNK